MYNIKSFIFRKWSMRITVKWLMINDSDVHYKVIYKDNLFKKNA